VIFVNAREVCAAWSRILSFESGSAMQAPTRKAPGSGSATGARQGASCSVAAGGPESGTGSVTTATSASTTVVASEPTIVASGITVALAIADRSVEISGSAWSKAPQPANSIIVIVVAIALRMAGTLLV